MGLVSKLLAQRALPAGALVWAVLQVAPAVANTYDLTFTGSAFDVSALITTSSALDTAGGYDVTNISGTVTGPTSGPIALLIPNPDPSNQATFYSGSYGWNYDNVLFAGATPVDNNGILFSFGSGILANIYSVDSTIYLSVDDPSQYWDPGDVGSLQVSPAPIPGTLLLFATGLGLVGWVGWRRQRHTVGLAAA